VKQTEFESPGFSQDAGAPGTFMTFYELVAREAFPAFFAEVTEMEW
jgi:hypothetical protein